jgi:hypothetical protein
MGSAPAGATQLGPAAHAAVGGTASAAAGLVDAAPSRLGDPSKRVDASGPAGVGPAARHAWRHTAS